jgi:hypothetical protein
VDDASAGTVDRSERWALLLAHQGARSVDLTGEAGDVPVLVPCLDGNAGDPPSDEEWTGASDLALGPEHAFLVGICDGEAPTARLWVLGR